MRHWYVYHSQKTMKATYLSLAESSAYSKSNRRELCLGDIIWVIEGDQDNPTNFSIADCFKYTESDYPSPHGPFSDFKLKISGSSLLKIGGLTLDKSMPWFDVLHSKYLSKQKSFNNITDENDIVNGLFDVSDAII
ncbi:hypothetical protein ACPUVO_09140 [Pseudocolwellia sp. HL-MZ19]|uniref:hypothetical protein n=1 Tax=Pseudocolwellia sp. HL-MZ19 TaxID=3400846 RepID=UPI003CF0B890